MKITNTIVKIGLGMGLMLSASLPDVNAADTAAVAKVVTYAVQQGEPAAGVAHERIGAEAGKDRVLIDFDKNKPQVEVETSNVNVSLLKKPDGVVPRVASGHQQDYPGVTFKAAAKYCDVVSFNLYRWDVSDFKLPEGLDAPVIIGEWHFGAYDRGPFASALITVEDQYERGRMYQSYARGVLKNPIFVGCHWYQYRDEPTIGRPVDGENFQVGFLDSVDTPYPETIEACRSVGYDLYDIRFSQGSY